MDIESIIELAKQAHTGQTDLMGREYFAYHLRPVAAAAAGLRPEQSDVVAAAWLHDILEDTPVTADDLRAAGVQDDVIEAVKSVTKREGESYDELIARAAANELGRWVKLADNTVNIANNGLLAAADPDKAASLLAEKYLPARENLMRACNLD